MLAANLQHASSHNRNTASYIRLKQTEDAVEVNAAEAEQGEKQEESQPAPAAPEEQVSVPAQTAKAEEVQAVQSMDGGEQEAKAVSWHRVNISCPYSIASYDISFSIYCVFSRRDPQHASLHKRSITIYGFVRCINKLRMLWMSMQQKQSKVRSKRGLNQLQQHLRSKCGFQHRRRRLKKFKRSLMGNEKQKQCLGTV